MNKRPIAFFDFDGTLTTRDSLMPFLKFASGATRYYSHILSLSPTLAAYALKILSNNQAKNAVLKRCLGGFDHKILSAQGELFSQTHIPSMLRTDGMRLLRQHQQQNHECVLVSASPDIYLQPWSKSEGFDHCICSILEVDKGQLSGALTGHNCYGPEKLNRILTLFPDLEHRKTFAYGDSKGDLQMLSACKHPYMMKSGVFVPFGGHYASKPY